MSAWKRKKNKSYFSNNRINFLIAIIFLLGGLLLYRLFELQIKNYDLYIAMASNQHQIFNKLEPKRGDIFMSSSKSGEAEKLHPLAVNKEFALVYAIPKEVKDYDELAEKLYEIFNREKIEEEVEEILIKSDNERLKKELDFVNTLKLNKEENDFKIAEVNNNHKILLASKGYIEIRNVREEAETILRKDKVVDDYLKKLKKRNDPYEPIERKVDNLTLLKLYALVGSDNNNIINPEELIIKKGRVWRKNIDNDPSAGGEEVILEGLSHNMVMHRYYPNDNIGAHIVGFTSLKNNEWVGNYGLEGFFDLELSGEYGSIKSERSADRGAIILNDREFNSALNGSEFVLTIDSSIQYAACKKLNEASLRHGADGGTVIIMEPNTGAILAMCSNPDYDPNFYKDVEDIKVYNNPAIFNQYEPGSVFKTITMAIALDQEKITPETKYFDEGQIMIEGWHKHIKNSDFSTHGGWGEVNMNIVLEESLNTGAIFAMRQAGKEQFAEYVKNFGFGEKTGIELETESQGNIRNLTKNKIQEIYAATASFGQGITVTPLQMINSYNAIANSGILMKPYLVKEIIHEDGEKEIIKPKQVRRVISAKAATLLSGMLVNVIEGGHAKLAAVDGYYMAGKTGTAQVASQSVRGYGDKTIHTFIGYGPVDDPKFVMLVKLDDPKDVKYSASSAAPLFGEIAEFLMQYYQVPKERD